MNAASSQNKTVKEDNINMTKNPYLITNLQFNRNIRNIDYLNSLLDVPQNSNKKTLLYENRAIYKDINKLQNHIIKEGKDNISYFHEYFLTIDDILSNFYLLINSIDQISNKSYVNKN